MGHGAYVPDLPGCVEMGDSLKETERLIRESDRIAPRDHVGRRPGDSNTSTVCDYVDVQP
jgi:hypothetical protein